MTVEDDLDVFAFRSDEQVGKYLSRPVEETVEASRFFIECINQGIDRREWIYWGISLASSERIIGTICLWNLSRKDHRAELGYELHPNHQKQGLMQEAIAVVLDYGFNTMNLRSIEAYFQTDNQASRRLLERSGFRFLKEVGEEEKFAAETALEMVAYVKEA